MRDQWEHKDIWVKRFGHDHGFTIEVSKHNVGYVDEFRSQGPHRWCVYVYIYPTHPFFKECVIEGKYGTNQRVADYLPLHGGCTFFHAHRDNLGEITSYQFGADYNHLHDEWYTHVATKEDAGSVFVDALELENYMIGKELK